MRENLKWKIVGLGSCGCRVAERIAMSYPWIGKAVFVSCDDEDLQIGVEGEKILLELGSWVQDRYLSSREAGFANYGRLMKALSGSELVVIASGLGGKVGSGLAPVVAKVSKELGCYALGLFIMPFRSQRTKKFRTGSSLRVLERLCDGIILVDNDELLETEPRTPVEDAYSKVNEILARALGEVARADELGIGARKFIEALTGKGCAILSVHEGKAGEGADEGVQESLKKVWRAADGRDAKSALLGIRGLTLSDIESIMEILRVSLGGSETEAEVGIGLNQGSLTSILLVSGLKKTKFHDYDPLGEILSGREMEEPLDCGLSVSFPQLARIE